MRKHRITCGLLTLLALVAGASVFAAPLPERLDAKVVLSSGVVARVEIVTIAFSSATPQITAFRWGADDSPSMKPPARIIGAFNVYLGDEKASIPFSAYSDLCEPVALTVKAAKRGFEVKIKGSDAGGAYEARLQFEGAKLLSRKVVSSEAPKNAWEETTYHNDFPASW